MAIQESEKELFLRAHSLIDYGFEFQGIEKYESFTKTRAFDGSYDLEYEFETPDSEEEQPLYLYVLVSVARRKSDASTSQGAEKFAVRYSLKANGISQEEIPNFYRYGDSSSFYVLKKEGKPIGNYFTVREGSKTYLLMISGFYFDDPELWQEIIEPRLKRFSSYRPN